MVRFFFLSSLLVCWAGFVKQAGFSEEWDTEGVMDDENGSQKQLICDVKVSFQNIGLLRKFCVVERQAIFYTAYSTHTHTHTHIHTHNRVYYTGRRVHSVKRKASVQCLSVCVSVPSFL